MLVKTKKLEYLAVDQDFFSGDSTKCFVLFRAKRSMQTGFLVVSFHQISNLPQN